MSSNGLRADGDDESVELTLDDRRDFAILPKECLGTMSANGRCVAEADEEVLCCRCEPIVKCDCLDRYWRSCSVVTCL